MSISRCAMRRAAGIIDVYSMNSEHPVRIEFFDNVVDEHPSASMSRSQRTIREVGQRATSSRPAIMLLTDAQLDEVGKTALDSGI